MHVGKLQLPVLPWPTFLTHVAAAERERRHSYYRFIRRSGIEVCLVSLITLSLIAKLLL